MADVPAKVIDYKNHRISAIAQWHEDEKVFSPYVVVQAHAGKNADEALVNCGPETYENPDEAHQQALRAAMIYIDNNS